MYQGIEIITEVKTQSPFGYQAKESWDKLFQIANKIGDIISIHTDPRWGGSLELLKQARTLTKKPILAKGIHEKDVEIEEAIRAGADWVLVVGRIPKIHEAKCFIEPRSLKELALIPPSFRVVWNSRDLETGGQKTETLEEARKVWPGWLCQASNIKTVIDIQPGANAILIGTHLVGFEKSLQA